MKHFYKSGVVDHSMPEFSPTTTTILTTETEPIPTTEVPTTTTVAFSTASSSSTGKH